LSDDSDKGLREKLESLERSLQQLKDGLGLLGLKPCSSCGVLHRRSDASALFHCDDFVCFKCIPLWWQQRSPQLAAHERQRAERELSQWLVSHHHAELILRPGNLPEHFRMKLVTGCEDCDGNGKSPSGKLCRRCDGRGTVWVVIRVPDFGGSK
jgi:hypothetical protein